MQKNVDLQAAAEEISRVSAQGFVDAGGPVIRLEGLDEDLKADAVSGGGGGDAGESVGQPQSAPSSATDSGS